MMTLAWIGWTEMLVIGVVAVLIFGRRLPEVGRSLGQGLLEFKKGIKDTEKDITSAVDEADRIAENSSKSAQVDAMNQD